MIFFSKPYNKFAIIVNLIALVISGCNPLGGDLKQSKFEEANPSSVQPKNTSSAPTSNWPFDALTTGLYSFVSTVIQFTGGVAELISTVQTDSEATEASDSTFTNGTKNGVVYGVLTDGSTQGLKLGNSGSCNGVTSDCAKSDAGEIYELSSSWTPRWANLIGYWKLNNSWVDSRGTNHGTTVGAASYLAAGKIGSHAGSFLANPDCVTMGMPASLRPTTSVAVSAWVYRTANLTNFSGIVSSSLTSNQNGYILVGTNTNRVRFYIYNAGWAFAESNTALNTNEWYLVTGVWTGTTVQIYINGVLQTTTGATAAISYGVPNQDHYIANYGGATWRGYIDEVAIWSSTLSATEVRTIYDRQKSAYSGTFTSRIMNAGSSSSWTTLSWIPTLPFLKELPDSTCATPCSHNSPESSSNYTSLVGSTGLTSDATISTSGLIGLWHLNNNWTDDSGQANNGTALVGATFTSNSKMGTHSGFFDGVDDAMTADDSTSLDVSAQMTIALWFKATNSAQNAGLVGKWTTGAGTNNSYTLILGQDATNNRIAFLVEQSDNTIIALLPATTYTAAEWTHLVAVADGGFLRLYVNGVDTGTTAAYDGTIKNTAKKLTIGRLREEDALYPYNGLIDEVAMWSRALHADEAKQLYQRGASRLKYQVRSCNDNACAGESWQGPDGTNETYFSELNSNTIPLTTLGDVLAALPSMVFSDFTSAPSNNQYFQYRTVLESDSSTAALMPELKSTTVEPIHYPTYLNTDTAPNNTIIGQNGIAFYDLNNFVQSLGAGGCSNGIVYNLGLSNTGPWKYWTGAAWVTADGSASQGNTAATLVASSNAALTAFATDVGRGTVFFKAFLTSTGTTKCELDNILLEINQ